jgi:hypothetical protein
MKLMYRRIMNIPKIIYKTLFLCQKVQNSSIVEGLRLCVTDKCNTEKTVLDIVSSLKKYNSRP